MRGDRRDLLRQVSEARPQVAGLAGQLASQPLVFGFLVPLQQILEPLMRLGQLLPEAGQILEPLAPDEVVELEDVALQLGDLLGRRGVEARPGPPPPV